MNYDSESSDATILSSNGIDEESAADNCEIAKILDLKIQLPQDLCENRHIFQELFSPATWNALAPKEKEHLTALLPTFPEHNEQERSNTVQQLFANKITRFGTSPLDSFHSNLQDGNYRPSIAQYRKQIMKAEEREQRIRMCERISMLAEKLVLSREKLLRSVYSACPEVLNTQSMPKQLSTVVAMRGSKRFAQELALIRAADDANALDDKASLRLTKKQLKQLDEMDKINFDSEIKITSTTAGRERRLDQILDTNISSDKFNYMLASYKKRKEIEPEHAEMEIEKLNLKEILDRSSLPLNPKKLSMSLNSSMQMKRTYVTKNSSQRLLSTSLGKKIKAELSDSDEEAWMKSSSSGKKELKQRISLQKPPPAAPSPLDTRKRVNEDSGTAYTESKKIVIDAAGKLKVLAVKGNKISQIERKKSTLYGHSPDSFNNNDSCESAESSPELKCETQNCFLSLIRDIFCSTCDHRMKLEELRRRINVWLKNPVAPVNSWYKEVDHWESLLTSAVLFLSGEFQYQPEDFVPYLEFKSNLNIYQWIGAGRDNDMRMLNLYKYWLSRHNEMGIRASNAVNRARPLAKTLTARDDQLVPTIRHRSDWKVRPATESELADYHAQERRRYETPNAPFTFRQHGYESVVGPLKQSSPPLLANARNDLLIAERAKFITAPHLVLDAVARLPNGEGSCADVCELLKSSQFLALNLNEGVLQTAINTILDTLSAEALNPSVRFDGKRKLWIYLHRNCSEDDFREMQLRQRKKIYRKIDGPVEGGGVRFVTNRPPIAFAKATKPNIVINVPGGDSKPALKALPKQFVTKAISSPTNTEPFDAEASLDAHTMPIVKSADGGKTQRVAIKAQNSPPKASPTVKGNNIVISKSSPKISTVIAPPKKVIATVGKNKVPPLIAKTSTTMTTTSESGQNYLIALNVNKQEPPALCATSPSSSYQQHQQQKNIVKISTSEKSVVSQPKYILTTSSLQKTGKLLTIPRTATPMLSQQKQILTNVIVEQQKAKSEQNQMLLAPPSTSNQATPTKLIQINSPQQQQQVFHLKQLKQDGGQQTMILKPQLIKTVTSGADTPTFVSVNKIMKSTTSPLTKTSLITTTASSRNETNTPIVARVISAGGRQLIDGSSLPKGATTFKVAGSNTTLQHGIIQIAGNANCSVISKGKNIVSLTPTQVKTNTAGLTVTKASPTTSVSEASPQQQPLKIIQSSPITTQQLLNAKLINVQGKNIKTTGGIKMINSQGYITNIGTKGGIPIILAAGKGTTTNATTSGDEQRIILQADSSQTGGFVINPTQNALKLQDNVLAPQQQTVVIGNQVLKLQPLSQLQGQKITKSATGQMMIATSSCETSGTVTANQAKKVITSTATSSTGGGQQIIFGSNFKVLKNMIKTSPQQTPATTTRIVLAPSGTQGGQQIAILPANFQGIKTLQGIKVIQQGRIVTSEKKPTTSPGPKDELSK